MKIRNWVLRWIDLWIGGPAHRRHPVTVEPFSSQSLSQDKEVGGRENGGNDSRERTTLWMFGMFRENHFCEVGRTLVLVNVWGATGVERAWTRKGGSRGGGGGGGGTVPPWPWVAAGRRVGIARQPTLWPPGKHHPPLLRDPKDVKCENHKKAAKRR